MKDVTEMPKCHDHNKEAFTASANKRFRHFLGNAGCTWMRLGQKRPSLSTAASSSSSTKVISDKSEKQIDGEKVMIRAFFSP